MRESALIQHPAVAEAAAFAVSNEINGEVPEIEARQETLIESSCR